MHHIPDTTSLRPQGFYGYAFLAARAGCVVALAGLTGLVSHFVVLIAHAGPGQDPRPSVPPILIAILVITSAALLWTLLSWSGYSRRYLPFQLTWAVDVLFFAPFVVLAVLLGRPLAGVRCAAVGIDGDGDEGSVGEFTITIPSLPGTQSGRVEFPPRAEDGDTRAVCIRMFAAWGLLLAVCILLAVSAMAVGFMQMRERRMRREFWEVGSLAYSHGGYGAGRPEYVHRAEGVGPSKGVGIAPSVVVMPATSPRSELDGFEKPGLVHREEAVANIPMGLEMAGNSDDAVLMNRPITIARLRGADGVFPRGVGYHDPLGPPATRRVYQGPRSFRSGSVSANETAGSGTRLRHADGVGLPSDPRAGQD